MPGGVSITKTPVPRTQAPPGPSQPARDCQCTTNICQRSCSCCKWCIRQAWEESALIVLLGGILLPCILDYIVLDRPSNGVGLAVLGICFSLSVISFWQILPYRLRHAHDVAREIRQHIHI